MNRAQLQPQYHQVPGHPYASYRTYNDSYGRFIIECRCSSCGAYWQKHCLQPSLANNRVFEFARLHGHGLRPRMR